MSCESVISVLLAGSHPVFSQFSLSLSQSCRPLRVRSGGSLCFIHQNCFRTLFLDQECFYTLIGNQALSLQHAFSPCAAVWDSGLYTANSRINHMYPRPIPTSLRLLVWVNAHCHNKEQQRWAVMLCGKAWWGMTFTTEVCRTSCPSVMIIAALSLEQRFLVPVCGTTTSMWVLPWSFFCSSRRQDWKQCEITTNRQPGLGEDT